MFRCPIYILYYLLKVLWRVLLLSDWIRERVLICNGSSEYVVHVWSELIYCLSHSFTLTSASNFDIDSFCIRSGFTSHVHIMFWATIWYTYHDQGPVFQIPPFLLTFLRKFIFSFSFSANKWMKNLFTMFFCCLCICFYLCFA